jgi:hypothetical protein
LGIKIGDIMTEDKIGLQEFTKMKEEILGIMRISGTEELFKEKLGTKIFKLYEEQKERFKSENFNIAILGEQGVGKTSLLDAILFKERILPIDVDETTNVITKVKRLSGSKQRSIIVFKTGEEKTGPATSKFLREYIDNEYNPKNAKGVKEAIIEYDHHLLKEGVVFADTPGLGSLTPENFQQTYDFLPQISAGILIFRTNPPLTESEIKDVIERTWEHSQYYFFVQNRWKETEKEFEDGFAYNNYFLNEIKEKYKSKIPIKIFPVDIHKAVEGACNNNELLTKESGIKELIRELFSFLNKNIGTLKILSFFSFLNIRARDIMESLIAEEENINDTKHIQKEEFEKKIKLKRKEIELIKTESFDKNREFFKQKYDLIEDFTSSIEKKLTQIGVDVKGLIRRRKLGAKKIQQIFEEKLKKEITPLTESYNIKYQQIIKEFIESYIVFGKRLKGIITTKTVRNKVVNEVERVEIAEKLGKVIQCLGGFGASIIVGDLVIGLAGLGGAAAGLGGAAAAAASIPVWGWIIAGVLLIGGFAIKKLSENKIIDKLTKEVDKAIVSLKEKYRQLIRNKLEENCDNIIQQLDRALKVEIARSEKELDIMQKDFYLTKKEKDERIEQIGKEKNILSRLFKELNFFAKRYKLGEKL